MRTFALLLTLATGPALADGLDCTFTQICSPLTDCQTHPGVPFAFDRISGTLGLVTGNGIAFGTPLSHVEPPALSLIFDTLPNETLLLGLSATGEAVLTQQTFQANGQMTSVSYFGTCEQVS